MLYRETYWLPIAATADYWRTTLEFHWEQGFWLVRCLETNTTAFAATRGQGRRQIQEALELQIAEMQRICPPAEFPEYLALTGLKRDQPPDCPGCGLPRPPTLPPLCAQCNADQLLSETQGPKHFVDWEAAEPCRALCGKTNQRSRFTSHNSSVECQSCIAKMQELGAAYRAARENILNRPDRDL